MALLSAIFSASRRVSEKRMSADLHHFTLGLVAQIATLPVAALALVLFGEVLNPFELGRDFWIPLIVISIGFYPLNSFLYFQSLKHGELSNVLPIMSLWPLFSLLPALLFLNEVPTLIATFGILFTVAGVYSLGLKGRRLHHPLQPFRENKSSRYTLMAVILLTVVAVLDKTAINASNPLYFSFLCHVGAVIVLSVMVYITGVKEGEKVMAAWPAFGLLGTLQGLSSMFYMVALSLGPIAYVTAIRSSSSLLGSLLGIFLLKEPFTINKKLALGFIAVGSILLAVGS